MKTIELIESQVVEVELPDSDAEALQAIARRLASTTPRGPTAEGSDDDNAAAAPLTIRPLRGGRWSLRVNDAIGVVATPGVTIISQPKIPEAHLLFLLEAGGYAPRSADSVTSLAPGVDLWRLVCVWFLAEAEDLLRRGLARDYRPTQDVLPVVRGRVRALPTVTNMLRGRPGISCSFEDFDEDSPLNRVVRAAARVIAASPLLDRPDRRRAFAVAEAMHGVGPVLAGDFRAAPTRATADYRAPFALARLVLRAQGPSMRISGDHAWTFLIRTPEVIEAGVRSILNQGSVASWDRVEKQTKRLAPSSLTMTPDLHFLPSGVVGDVKYRLGDGKWNRSHVYQAAAFATAFRAPAALVIGFTDAGLAPPLTVHVGDVCLGAAYWDASKSADPQTSAERLVRAVDGWIAACTGAGGAVPAEVLAA